MSTAKSSTPGGLIISVYDIDTAQRGLFAHFFLLSPTSIHHTLFLFFFYSDPCYADQSLRFFSLYSHYRPKRMFILPQNFPLIILSCTANMGTEMAKQLFMDDKEEQLVDKATKMKSNWCTLLALSSAYLLFPSQSNFPPISSPFSFSK